MLAALNGLEILGADAQNAYINSPPREHYWIWCGPEFGHHEGKKALIVRALYGMKSSGAAWRSYLADILRDVLKFEMCKADNDVWFRKAIKPDGTKYYEYILVYTDDFLVLSTDPHAILKTLQERVVLKADSIKEPDRYLGATVSKYYFEDGDWAWAMSSEQYVKEAIRNVKNWLTERDLYLKKKAPSVLPTGYRPELDLSALCGDEEISYFQEQIGVLRWAVELGRVDIANEVSMLASYCAMPRVGHLNAMFHIYAYLNTHERSKIVFDPSYIPHIDVEQPDWSDFYPNAKEELPPDMPEPRGEPVVTTTFEDSDHASDVVTRRSRTGVLIYCNRAPVLVYSKKQNSIETSSFGSEFTALKTAVELTEGIRYKLRMMGVPVDGPAYIKGDNYSVIQNSSLPQSVLKKKSNSIAYHYVRERCAMDVCTVSWEPSESNVADMLTKIQTGPVRKRLAQMVLK